MALSSPLTRDRRLTDEEFETLELRPDSVAGQDPELFRDTLPLSEATSEAMYKLTVHFGRRHELVDRYIDAASTCLWAEEVKSRYFRSPEAERMKIENMRKLSNAVDRAYHAADRWLAMARDGVDET